MQRPFHPEGPQGACHVYVLHPPGGIVGGDCLTLDVEVHADAQALLTTPGASKLYRARAHTEALLAQRFEVARGGVLEWLPQETIVFDGAMTQAATEVSLAAEAHYAGWEIVCLGRPASAERFLRGELRSGLSIRRADRLIYLERGLYRGGDPSLAAPWGLGGSPVVGTFVVASPLATTAWVSEVREAVSELLHPSDGRAAATLVSGVLVVRYLGGSTRVARRLFERAFGVLRPLYAGQPAVLPRIWST